MPELPVRPSAEYLRKLAKRIAREQRIQLADAQRLVARDFGFRDWAALQRQVAAMRAGDGEPAAALVAAVRRADAAAVERALADGANPRILYGGETPLHTAARLGLPAVVETLIVGGALEWVRDAEGRLAVEVAREGTSPGHAAVVTLLDPNAIADGSFRAAVDAIHRGDVDELARLIDAEPRLLRERTNGPEIYRKRARRGYFTDPKLFWFVANNPTMVEPMPRNSVAVAQTMIERGVDQADLDYTLELVMTNSVAREQGLQRPMMDALFGAGARVSRGAIVITAAYRETAALYALLERGVPLDVPIAAALGDASALRDLVQNAPAGDVQLAFGLAVINGHVDAIRAALDAGADINAYLPVHSHSTALHDAAARNDLQLIAFLLAAGARTDIRDTLWDGTPLGWARHAGNAEAEAALQEATAT